MKKQVYLCLAIAALGIATARAEVKTQVVRGTYMESLSDNGEWMVGTPKDGSLTITELETGKTWSYYWDGNDGTAQYTSANTRAISNDGTVVGEVGNIPSYWRKGADGKGAWTELKGYKKSNSGYVFATVGAITPDGSMIVGSLGKGGGDLTDDGDEQWTYPCIWLRNDDGTYGEPVWLPNIDKDLFGRAPQYMNAIAVSEDGLTIGAQMRGGSGQFHFPYVYTLQSNGEWDIKALGMNLVNPKNITPYPFPGDYDGDLPAPNYEEFMTPEQLAAFYDADIREKLEMENPGLTDDDIRVLELYAAADFMNEDKAREYLTMLNAWANSYNDWADAWEKYEKSVVEIMESGYDFIYNNIFLSPDGKYLYSSAKPQMAETYIPVRISVEGDSDTFYNNDMNLIVSCVTADYSVLAYPYDPDAEIYRMAYIFPQGNTTAVEFPEFYKDNSAVYDWMEEQMYQSVSIGMTASGADQFDDRWCLGKPYATPDMSLLAFSSSTFYWETQPAGFSGGWITFLINPQDTEPENPENPENPDDSGVDAIGSESGTAVFYNLQGARVSNPDRGIFVKVQDGKAVKVLK